MSKSDFSNMGLPDVEIVPRPRGSILRTTRASQLPYGAKSFLLWFIYIFYIFLYMAYFPWKEPPMFRVHPQDLLVSGGSTLVRPRALVCLSWRA